jgi:hypothetical protein
MRCLGSAQNDRSEWRWHSDEENRDHHERDKEFANHCTEISQQTPPPGSAGIYHSLARDEFTGDRANHRSNKQTGDPKEDADESSNHRAEHPPLCGPEMSRPEVTTEKVERIRRQRQYYEENDGCPADAFLWPEHHPVEERAGKNDDCARKYRQDCADQPNCEQDHRQDPPEEFHAAEELLSEIRETRNAIHRIAIHDLL